MDQSPVCENIQLSGPIIGDANFIEPPDGWQEENEGYCEGCSVEND